MKIVKVIHLLVPLLNKVDEHFILLGNNLESLNKDFPTELGEEYWIDNQYSFKSPINANFMNAIQSCVSSQAKLFAARPEMNLTNIWAKFSIANEAKVWTSYKVRDDISMIGDPYLFPIIDRTYTDKIGLVTAIGAADCVVIKKIGNKLFATEKSNCSELYPKICYKKTPKNVTHDFLERSLERVQWSLDVIQAERGRAKYLKEMYHGLKSFPKIKESSADSTVDNREGFKGILETISFTPQHFPDIASYNNELVTLYLDKLKSAIDYSEGYLDSILLAPSVLNITNDTIIHSFYPYPINDETVLIKEYERLDASTDFFLNFFVFTIFDVVLAVTAVSTLIFTCVRTYQVKNVTLSVRRKRSSGATKKAVKLVDISKPTHPSIEYTSTSSSDESSSSDSNFTDCCPPGCCTCKIYKC